MVAGYYSVVIVRFARATSIIALEFLAYILVSHLFKPKRLQPRNSQCSR